MPRQKSLHHRVSPGSKFPEMYDGDCRGDHWSPGNKMLRIRIGFGQIRRIVPHGRAVPAPTIHIGSGPINAEQRADVLATFAVQRPPFAKSAIRFLRMAPMVISGQSRSPWPPAPGSSSFRWPPPERWHRPPPRFRSSCASPAGACRYPPWGRTHGAGKCCPG